MRRKTLSTALLFALALPLSNTALAAASVTFSETPTSLLVTWEGTIADFDTLNDQLSALQWWKVNVGDSFADAILGGAIPVYGATLTAQHHSEIPAHPHAGEQLESWIFNPTLATTSNASAYTHAEHLHPLEFSPIETYTNGNGPMGICQPHHDCYTLALSAAGGGTGTMTLQGIHPVPEPETFAMFLAGLGIMGVMAGRRKTG